jgi:hypothetical protein
MLSKCANPACSNLFLYLHQGKLFRLDTNTLRLEGESSSRKKRPRIEYFWLCDNCAAEMTVVFRKGKGVVVRSFHTMQRVAS